MFLSVCFQPCLYAWVMYEVITVQVIRDPFHSFPYALINSTPQPLQHPQTANGVLIERYNTLLNYISKVQ